MAKVHGEDPEAMLTIREVCMEVSVSRTVILAIIRSGELPAVKASTQAGRPWLVKRLALESWVQQQQAATRRYVEDNPRGGEGMWDLETGEAQR